MTATESSAVGGVVSLRSIYVSPPVDAESQSDAAQDVSQNNRSVNGEAVDRFQENKDMREEEGALDPIQLPQSTHSLLFTSPVFSLPFAFAVGILAISFLCLGLAFANTLQTNDIPVNVSWGVRGAQYLSIIIALLMEEGEVYQYRCHAMDNCHQIINLLCFHHKEIPTGFYLLRMIPKQSLHQKFPQMKYRKFIFSSIVRIFNGYYFLVNVLLVLVQATGVIEIFYDVLALQFVQQLDDIAFNLAKMDVFGKTLQRACTAKYFHAEFEKQRSGKIKHLSRFLKTLYFINLCGMLAGMGFVSTKQIRGLYYDSSINVNFGDTVWETAWVKVPSWIPSYIQSLPGQDEEWTLVYSYFNGEYEKNGTQHGRPIYKERRKSDRTHFHSIIPAEIKYCNEIGAWVFTHEDIRRKKSATTEGCNWLLRSPETDEYNLLNVVGDWQVWVGVIGNAEVSISSNECKGNSDCNLNGKCEEGECKCNSEDGVQYLGTHCEVGIRDQCRTIIGELSNETVFAVEERSDKALFQEYSRPVYLLYDDNPGTDDDLTYVLIYSGNRWFGTIFSGKDTENVTAEESEAFWLDYHAFWYRAYSALTFYVSDPTTGSTPVGVDFHVIGERGEQFGPFGALYPIQLHNQTGRGYFRCGDSDAKPGNASTTDRKLRFQSLPYQTH
ncbi:hypothetical protein ACHAXR_005587 [Thalassiosira sp. AJA248-18]